MLLQVRENAEAQGFDCYCTISNSGMSQFLNDSYHYSATPEIISAGQVVKAMILNGLGFVSAPLYMFEKFFVGKATEHLLGEGVRPEHLNDDRLGRVLDKLYQAGLTEIFVRVALQAARQFGVKMNSLHLDSSSFHVDGEYTKNVTVHGGRSCAYSLKFLLGKGLG